MNRPAVLLIVVSLVGANMAAAAAAPVATSPIDGRWTWTWTRADLTRVGSAPYDVKTLNGPEVLIFANGGYRAHNLRTGRVDGGRFTVKGYVVTFIPEVGPVNERRIALMTFSIYRDRLTWGLVPGRHGWRLLTTTPWTRST